MKTFITILMSCSLALAASVLAQQEEPAGSPEKGRKQGQSQPVNQASPMPRGHNKGRGETGAPGQQTTGAPTTSEASPRMHGKGKGKEQGKAMTTETPSPNAAEGQQPGKHGRGRNATNATEGNATGAESPSAGGEQGKHGRKGRSVTDEAATANKANSPAPSNSVAPSATAAAQTNTNVNAGANVNANANVAGGGRIRGHGKGGKQLDAQVVQKVKTEHASFKAQPRPDKVQAVTFSENHRIEGAEHWQGERYAAFRSYHSEHHDHDWWHSHYPRIEIIAGGAYYWNNGYWYPAWGYDNSAQYYAYDGPIYVGHRAEPPDKVIADVQAVLQDAGYYTGEVDGLLGPLTRQALADYQSDNGLMVTQAIDEPTLESLDLS